MNEKKATGSKKIVIVIVAMLVVIAGMAAALVMVLANQKEQKAPAESKVTTSQGSNIVVTEDSRESLAALNAKVKEGRIVVKMTGNWVFAQDCTVSNGYLANSERNTYPMTYEVILKEGEEVLLTTPEVPVGSCIENFGLDVVLEPGEYEVYVVHHQMKDGEIYNSVTTEGTITVQ